MIKIEKAEVSGIPAAIRGMRNPLNSWDKSDSNSDTVGIFDKKLMCRLAAAGPEHRKYLRMIMCSFDVTAPLFWWKEMDTYKIATVRNSCSTMHKIGAKEFSIKDFSTEGIEAASEDGDIKAIFDSILHILETLRREYNETKDKDVWRALIELLPSNYNMKSTMMMNYETLLSIYFQRRNHKLFEWQEFCKWIEQLPLMDELIKAMDQK